MAQKKGDGDKVVVIKKYANRRLYNTATSSYVTLDNLAAMVREGKEFLVQDAKTGEDITRSVLTQIIFEAEAKGRAPLLPQGVFWDAMADVQITIPVFSSCRLFDFSCKAAIGLFNRSRWSSGTLRQVMTSDDHRVAMVKDKFWGRF